MTDMTATLDELDQVIEDLTSQAEASADLGDDEQMAAIANLYAKGCLMARRLRQYVEESADAVAYYEGTGKP